jgi:hypothetical protein
VAKITFIDRKPDVAALTDGYRPMEQHCLIINEDDGSRTVYGPFDSLPAAATFATHAMGLTTDEAPTLWTIEQFIDASTAIQPRS